MSKRKKNNKLEIIGLATNIILTLILTVFTIIETNKLTELYPKEQEIFLLLIAIVILYLSIYIQLIIHETGHLIFGLATGYKFSSFRSGSIMLIKTNKEFKFKTLKLSGTGGQCLMTPPDLVDDKMPVILFNLGGAIINILTAIIFGILYLVFKENNILAYVFEILSLFGVYFAALNGIPMKMGIIDNDGYNAISLHNNKNAQKAFWTQLKVNEMISKNKRLKELPNEWFVVEKNDNLKNSIIATIAVYECNKLMDEHDFKKANKKMTTLLKQETAIVGVHQNLMICDRIYCELIEGNINAANKLYNNEQKKFMESMKTYPSVIRTNYVIALLFEKNQEKANKLLKDFRKRSKSYPYPSDIRSERELISIATTISKN